MKIVEVNDEGDRWRDPWNAYVADHQNGFPLQVFDWQHVLQDCFSVQPHYAVCVDQNRLCGLIPLYQQKSPIFGHTLDTLEGAILASSTEAGLRLIDFARRRLSQTKAQKMQLRGGFQTDSNATLVKPRVHTTIDLTTPDLWGQLTSNQRRKVRKAEKEGAEIRTEEQIPDAFHDVYLENQRNLGTPEQGKAYFTSMNRRLKGHLLFHGVWLDQTLAAGIVSVGVGSTWLNLYVASRADYRKIYVVNAAYWESISAKIARGAKTLDLGRSVENSGNHRFKQDWCSDDEYMDYATIQMNTTDATENNQSAQKALARLWKTLPLPIARIAGPLLRRGYPFS